MSWVKNKKQKLLVEYQNTGRKEDKQLGIKLIYIASHKSFSFNTTVRKKLGGIEFTAKLIETHMKKLFFISLLVILPFITNTKTAEARISDTPLFIYAPAINLFSPIQTVGTNEKGEMDVPSGDTNNVGWYRDGVVPGNTGTAVLDAHVFAAFKDLSKLPVGSDIYIYMASGKVLRFVTKASQLYPLSTLSSSTLFAATNSKQLNLITCAGALTWDFSTYTHRLIVSAELV